MTCSVVLYNASWYLYVHEKLNFTALSGWCLNKSSSALCQGGKAIRCCRQVEGDVPRFRWNRPNEAAFIGVWPLSECVAESQKWKSVNQRMKPQKFTVVVLKKYMPPGFHKGLQETKWCRLYLGRSTSQHVSATSEGRNHTCLSTPTQH